MNRTTSLRGCDHGPLSQVKISGPAAPLDHPGEWPHLSQLIRARERGGLKTAAAKTGKSCPTAPRRWWWGTAQLGPVAVCAHYSSLAGDPIDPERYEHSKPILVDVAALGNDVIPNRVYDAEISYRPTDDSPVEINPG